MKGKEIINLIKENKLEDFDINVTFTDGYNVFPNVRSVNLTGLADIGHSDNIAFLDGELDE